MYEKLTKNYILLLISLLSMHSFLLAQTECSEVINVNSGGKTAEVFYVRSNDPAIKEGRYIFKNNNVIQIKGHYQNNLKEGEWLYQPNSSLKIMGNYKHDKKEGKWIYSRNKTLISVLTYYNDSLIGPQTGYHENGNIQSEEYYRKGKLHGEVKTYYASGNLKEISIYKDGKLHGESIHYTIEGSLISKLMYSNDTPISLMITEGLDSLSNFSGNLKNGTGCLKTISWTNSKECVLLERNFKDSLLHGNIIRYSVDGKKVFSGSYQNGYMNDRWLFYDHTGNSNRYNIYNALEQRKMDPFEPLSHDYNEKAIKLEDLPKFGKYNQQGFQYFIAKAVKYPVSCINNGITGRVLVNFEINLEGKVQNAQVVKPVHPLLDKAAIKAVLSSPLWTPAFINQLPKRVSYTVPINFYFM
ncbi:TonB family protein [Marinifilum caeruleilacunae]|uniref:TonB family protein n=1 Tax=Marinifilum caeruleilacunae TaxID=2499076 RepID=A0ABX1WVU9_9BACT|nr:TonB family protein [Marinifilum caeruleilacunae]NOU60187.1 TonB family protein [Marinifilum caeruleilacunae]